MLSFVLGAQKDCLNDTFFEYPKHMLWLANGKNSLNLEAREVHIYRTGKTTAKPAKTTTGIYIRIPSDGLLMPLPHETHRADRLICLFDLILYVPSTILQLNRDGSSCVEPVLS